MDGPVASGGGLVGLQECAGGVGNTKSDKIDVLNRLPLGPLKRNHGLKNGSFNQLSVQVHLLWRDGVEDTTIGVQIPLARRVQFLEHIFDEKAGFVALMVKLGFPDARRSPPEKVFVQLKAAPT